MLRSELCRGGKKPEVLISKPVVMTLNSCKCIDKSSNSRTVEVVEPLTYGRGKCQYNIFP